MEHDHHDQDGEDSELPSEHGPVWRRMSLDAFSRVDGTASGEDPGPHIAAYKTSATLRSSTVCLYLSGKGKDS
jgi:hypothetical protein